MLSKGVIIRDSAKQVEPVFPTVEFIGTLLADCSQCAYTKLPLPGWHDNALRTQGGGVHFTRRIERPSSLDNSESSLLYDIIGWRLALIYEDHRRVQNRALVQFSRGRYLGNAKPHSLVNLEVMSEVMPLPISYVGVPYSSENSDDLKTRFPPAKGLIPLILGIIGLYWAWIPIRESRCALRHAIAFPISIICLAYGFSIVLSWSVL